MRFRLIRTARDLRDAEHDLARREGLGGAFVPTMGALHQGHAALIRRAAELAQSNRWPAGAGVSIFVNPTQFNDPRDFDRYPRTLDDDLELCQRAGAAWAFAPDAIVMYPDQAAAPVPPLPPVATQPGLEDAHRPGHFAGVAQVVLRLFGLLRPDAALFGEKDWQQLAVVNAITHAARVPTRIIPCPTVREPDGLAMSSRNVFLDPEQRRRARAIHQALDAAARAPEPARAESIMRRTLDDAGLETEYAVVRDAETLDTLVPGRPARALIAARCGTVRLIDNAPWPNAS